VIVDLSGTIRDVLRFKGQYSALYPILRPDLTPSLGMILSQFPDEPYLAGK